MAQWQELLRLNLLQGNLSELYETKFPGHIRQSLCVGIESQDWDLAAVDSSKATACFCALLLHLQEQCDRSMNGNNGLPLADFPGIQAYLLKEFLKEPQRLAIILSECLKEEKRVLALNSEKQACVSQVVANQRSDLDNLVTELKMQMMDLKKANKSLEDLYKILASVRDAQNVSLTVQQNPGFLISQAVNEECLRDTDFIIQTKQIELQQIEKILNQAMHIVRALIDVELPEWKRRQQMACIGCPADTCLDHLQKWFTTVAEVLLQICQHLQKMQDQNSKYSNTDVSTAIEEILRFAQSLFIELLANALVVEKQPVMPSLPQRPLIVKTGVRFSATVRFLANLPEFKDLLKITAVFDKDVEEAWTVKGFRRFNFSNDNKKFLDVASSSGAFVAEFTQMSLKEVKGRTKGSTEQNHISVTEELHVIKFVTTFQHAGLKCDIEASSLPVIVITSTSQVPSAWASVMWWNMLSTSEPRNLSLFSDPPPLTWQQVSQMLSWQFLLAGQRELDENQLFMIREKLGCSPDGYVQWSYFSKNETAWIWIDGILDLIKKHLVDLWREGYIMGFVSRRRTENLLREKPPGTFLLRFSESKNGAITFSWVDHSHGETQVHAVKPYTKHKLDSISLPDILYRYTLGNEFKSPLTFLYPDIPKDTAFKPYCTTTALLNHKCNSDGYIERILCFKSAPPTPPESPPMDVHMDAEMDANMEIK